MEVGMLAEVLRTNGDWSPCEINRIKGTGIEVRLTSGGSGFKEIAFADVEKKLRIVRGGGGSGGGRRERSRDRRDDRHRDDRHRAYNDIQELILKRTSLRDPRSRYRDLHEADRIRDELVGMGVQLDDDNRVWRHPDGLHGTYRGKLGSPPKGELSSELMELVQKVKARQRQDRQFKSLWQEYCSKYGNGNNDPQRHDVSYLREALEHCERRCGGGGGGRRSRSRTPPRERERYAPRKRSGSVESSGSDFQITQGPDYSKYGKNVL